eukprot:SAG11_NODE_30367_length_301_cov_2.024752_1_plen_26_part_10
MTLALDTGKLGGGLTQWAPDPAALI